MNRMPGKNIVIYNQNEKRYINLMEGKRDYLIAGIDGPEADDPYKIELLSADFGEPIQAAATVEVTEDNFIKPNSAVVKFCLVCNKISKTTNGEFLIIQDDNHVTKYSKKTIQFTLELLLNIEKFKDSDFICTNCCDLVNNWDYHLCEIKKIQANLLQWYRDACDQRTSRKQIFEKDFEFFEDTGNASNNHDADYKPYFYFRTKNMKKRNMPKIKAMPADCNQTDPADDSLGKADSRDQDQKESSEKENHSANILISNTKRQKLDDETMYCSFCNYSGTCTEDYMKHKDGHYCKICNLFLKRPTQIRSHLEMVHNLRNANPFSVKFTCHLCSKKYCSKSSLYNHKKTTHSKKRYPCDICSKSFQHPRILQGHKVRHDAKKVHCDKCEASFYLNTELAKHVNQVHNKVKPYICHVCYKHFCQRSVLNHHLSQHVHTKEIKSSGRVFTDTDVIKLTGQVFTETEEIKSTNRLSRETEEIKSTNRLFREAKELKPPSRTVVNIAAVRIAAQASNAVRTPNPAPAIIPETNTNPGTHSPNKMDVSNLEISVSPIKLNLGAWQLLNSSMDLNIGQEEGSATMEERSKIVSPLFSTEQMQDVESAISLLNGNETNPAIADFDAYLVESMLANDSFFVST